MECFNAFMLCAVYSLFCDKRFFSSDYSRSNFFGRGAVRCHPLAIQPRILVSSCVARTQRAQATAYPIAQLVDTSTIFPLRRRLDVAFRHDQVGQFRNGIAAISWIISSRPAEVLNVPATRRYYQTRSAARCKISRRSGSEETAGRILRKMG